VKARDNPFRVSRVLQARYRFLDTTWPEFMARLARMKYRGALVGPMGSGKTTLLEDLEPRLAEQGFACQWLRLSDRAKGLSARELAEFLRRADGRSIVLVDGAECLDGALRRQLTLNSASAAGLVVTAHRPGLLPTVLECHTTPGLLEQVVKEVMGPGWIPGGVSLSDLFHRHQGNIRAVLMALYDLFAAGCPGLRAPAVSVRPADGSLPLEGP
jgi:hypothetical protein